MSQRERMRHRQSKYAQHLAQHPAPAPVHLHIEQLIVDGIAYSARDRFANSMNEELARTFMKQTLPGIFTASMQTGQITTAKLTLTSTMQPEMFGRQVARTVYGGLGQLQSDRK